MSILKRRAFYIALIALSVGATACGTSSGKYRDASDDIADRLANQVQTKTDLRSVRVVVYEFNPCASPPVGRKVAKGGGHTADEFARQIKHQLITALARKMIVIEGGPSDHGHAGDDEHDELLPEPVGTKEQSTARYPEAESLGANAVLVGNYFVDGDEAVLLMARLVDVKTNEILATAEETIKKVELPHEHK